MYTSSYSVSSDVLSYAIQFDLLLFVHECTVQFNTEDCHWKKIIRDASVNRVIL